MTEDTLREASMYLRRCDSDRCATERALRLFPHCRFRFLGPPGLWGERPRRPKGIEAFAASTKKREKDVGSLVDVECIKIKRGKVLSNIRLVNIPTGLFVVEFGRTSVWVTNWREGEDNFNGEMVRAKARRAAPLTVGARDAGANEISGEERLPVEW